MSKKITLSVSSHFRSVLSADITYSHQWQANPEDNTLKANPDDNTLKANPALCKHTTKKTISQIMYWQNKTTTTTTIHWRLIVMITN